MAPVYRPERVFKKPYCKRNHDKAITGIRDSLGCWLCYLDDQRRYKIRRHHRNMAGRPPYRPDITVLMDRIEHTRKALGLSRHATAKRLGISASSYFRLLSAECRPKPSTLERVLPNLKTLADEANERIRRAHEKRARRERDIRMADPSQFSGRQRLPLDAEVA